MSTAPFREDAEVLLSRSIGHYVKVEAVVPSQAAPIPLDVEDVSIAWDETQAPRVQCEVTAAVPEDQVTLDLLDPRTGVRLNVYVGYIRPGGDEDVHLVADLGLRERTVNRPSNTMDLTAMSDEMLVIDGSPANLIATGAQASVPEAMRLLMYAATVPDVTVVINHPDQTPTSVSEISDRWETITDLADQIEAAVYDNGLRDIVIEPRVKKVTSVSAATLKVGTNGTILRSDTTLSRDEWANYVYLEYQWRNAGGTDSRIIGTATAATGSPFDIAVAGMKIEHIQRESPTTQTAADKAAAVILGRMLSRSRSYSLTAIAAYWLRPGDTVTVQLPTGGQERHLVASVRFDPINGTMDVKTRLPDTASVTGE